MYFVFIRFCNEVNDFSDAKPGHYRSIFAAKTRYKHSIYPRNTTINIKRHTSGNFRLKIRSEPWHEQIWSKNILVSKQLIDWIQLRMWSFTFQAVTLRIATTNSFVNRFHINDLLNFGYGFFKIVLEWILQWYNIGRS